MKFSVVIPFHREDDFLRSAVKSAFEDLQDGDELILVDDIGCSQSLRRWMETLPNNLERKASISLIRNPNGGVITARNLGVQESRNELISFLDSDDLWLKGRRLRHAKILEELPESPGVGSTVEYICLHDFVLAKSWLPKRGSVLEKGWNSSLFSIVLPRLKTSAVTIRKDRIIAAGGFRSEEYLAEDWGLWLRVQVQSGQFALDPVPGAAYRYHPEQISSKVKVEANRFARQLSQEAANRLLVQSGKTKLARLTADSLARRGLVSRGLGESGMRLRDIFRDLEPSILMNLPMILKSNRRHGLRECNKCMGYGVNS